MASVPNRSTIDGSCFGAVAIVASAGGIPALIELFRGLEPTFPLPIFVAQHLPRIPSSLDRILSWHSMLPVRWAEPATQSNLAGVYLARPGTGIRLTTSGIDIDVLPAPATAWLSSGDRMIESVFARFGQHTAAIVLSGMMPAGVEGIRAVRHGGGITIAQDRSSSHLEMPAAAIDFGKAEIVCPPLRMARVLNLLAAEWGQAKEQPASRQVDQKPFSAAVVGRFRPTEAGASRFRPIAPVPGPHQDDEGE
ncbi:MAG TPA: chemotaxis protein CheB [Pseudolabrys sp.]|nr:chemotaxis protein CheB [Pseudolabrys sp.]